MIHRLWLQGSSVWRLTLSLSALTAGIQLVILFLLYQLLLGSQQREVSQHLNSEANRLSELAQQLDVERFRQQLLIKLQDRRILYAWQGEEQMLGPFSLLPSNVPNLPKTTEIPVLDPSQTGLQLFTAGIAHTKHGPVMVALSTKALSQLKQQFIQTSLLAGCAMVLLSLGLGYLLARRQLRRLLRFNRLAKQVERGDLNARLPFKKQGDEFDQLAGHFNHVLDSLTASLATVQGITDHIAHDLRTPLSRLRLGLEARLTQDPTLGQELEQIDTLLATFEAMLSLTRLEKGQRQLDRSQVAITPLCDDLLEMMQFAAEDHGQTLQHQVPVELSLNADRNLLFQALFNLVDNAIKYAGYGANIAISAEPDCDGITLWVQDNGPGVAPEHYEKLTQRLYRVDQSRQQPGLGLGLATVKAICQAHGGQLKIEDNQPGLRFGLSLPN